VTINEVRCVAPTGDDCGEGLVWSSDERSLYWTDINRYLIHCYDVAAATTKTWMFEEPVVALALTRTPGKWLVALASRLIWWHPSSDLRLDQGFFLPDFPGVRLNDGRAGPNGDFYIGSMKNTVDVPADPKFEMATAGRLFRIGRDGVDVLRERVGISNTVCWSPGRERFYFGDSFANVIRMYDYDPRGGGIENEREFFAGFARGLPDGSAIDREGFLWNCRYGGSCIVRVAPDGRVDRIVEMPVKNVTTCTFGGPMLETLYITTARGGDLASGRLAGSLFALAVDTPGLPELPVNDGLVTDGRLGS
jgi:sugar lactone lactonase YvrE